MNLFDLLKRYNPNQPRDRNGRWGRGGASQVDTLEAPQSTQRDARGIPMPPDTSKWGPAAARPKRQMAELYEAAQRGDIDSIKGTKTSRSNTYARTVDDYKAALVARFAGDTPPPPPPPPPPRRRRPRATDNEGDTGTTRVKPGPTGDAHQRFRTPEERAYNDAAFKNADPELRELVDQTPPVGAVLGDTSRSAYARAGTRDRRGEINMTAYSPKTEEGRSVWAHEYGHHVDGASSGLNNAFGQSDYASATTATVGAAGKDANRVASRGQQIRTELAKLKREESVMASDFFGAMTMNKVGQGHSAEYYNLFPKVPGTSMTVGQTVEMFGNYIALRSSKGDGYKMLKKYAPETVKHFDKLVKDMVAFNRKRNSEDGSRLFKWLRTE